MEGIVYLITNTANGQRYVGSTTKTLQRRMILHKYERTRKPNIPLYDAMNAFGFHNFTIEPLLKMKYFDKQELFMVEDAYIAIYDTINNGYNVKYAGMNYAAYEPTKKQERDRKYRDANREAIKARLRQQYAKRKENEARRDITRH